MAEKRDKPPVDGWRKPVLDSDVVARLREILRLNENDDLPESVWRQLALQMAFNRHLHLHEMTYTELCRLCMEADQYREPSGIHLTMPGRIVGIKSERKNAYYIGRGPFGMHLVNKFGMFQLVNPDDIEVEVETSQPVTGKSREASKHSPSPVTAN